jgi:LPXTG-motif cell wall-anchored protein
MDADTQLREKAALEKRVAKLEGKLKTSFLKFDSDTNQAALGGVGGGLLLLGTLGFGLARKREKLIE